jgi:acyl-CoA thioesterase I
MRYRWASLLLPVLFWSCSKPDQTAAPGKPSAPARPAPAAAPDNRPVIVAFGDSLTAGLGLASGSTYPDFLQQELNRQGYKYRVENMGISGDTTSGGVDRISAALALQPRIVILELGANDGLRGLPLETTRSNLAEMIDAFQGAGAKVLLCGMTLPRNYGPDYIHGFEQIFATLAREKRVVLIPFFLDGVATTPALMQGDGLHPNTAGARKVSETVTKYLKPLL